MAGKRATSKGSSAKRKPSVKRERFVEEYVKSGNAADAARKAGYSGNSNHTFAQQGHQLLTNIDIRDRVERRRAEALRLSQFHTNELVGMLFEATTAGISDVLEPDGTFDPIKCGERGKDHLVKKSRRTERHSKDGSRRVTYEVEMYSRLDAIDQLRDTFGMKQEPRPNNYDELKRTEVERSVNKIMERDGIEKREAALILLAELGDSPELTPIINSYVN
jgi:phage terminase small subunit